MLQVSNLHKTYGGRTVVAGVSFTVPRGQIVGLLGPNGAGKTTTVSMICGLTSADRGEVTLSGERIEHDASPVKRRIGLVPQDLALYEGLSALANVETFGALYGLESRLLKERALAALELVGLAERARDRAATFSGGMKRRLNIACALAHDPDILLLDEPTVGIDPQSRNAIFDNLETLKARGKTMVYTTHYMEEAERLCDSIVIMDHGKVIADDTLEALHRHSPAVASLEISVEGPVDTATLAALAGVTSAVQTGNILNIGLKSLTAGTAAVLNWLDVQGHRVTHLRSARPSLESLFLALTGRQLRDE